jgi:hypothetical protein
MLNKIICKFKGHKLISAGSCPYTGKTYDVCSKCMTTFIAKDSQEGVQ